MAALTDQEKIDKAAFETNFTTAQTRSGVEIDKTFTLIFFTDFKGNNLFAKGKIMNIDPVALNPTIKPIAPKTTVDTIASAVVTWDMNGNCVVATIAAALGINPSFTFSLVQPVS